jgi:cell wall-associated NlpC family hydrolase
MGELSGKEVGRRIVETARGFLGAAYRHQGRGPHHFDCIGMPACVARELGLRSKGDGELLRLHDTPNYTPVTGGRSLYRELRKHLHLVPKLKEARDGDLLLFIFPDAAHTAILADGGRRMIHASRNHNKVVENVLGEWEAQIRAIFRFDEAL